MFSLFQRCLPGKLQESGACLEAAVFPPLHKQEDDEQPIKEAAADGSGPSASPWPRSFPDFRAARALIVRTRLSLQGEGCPEGWVSILVGKAKFERLRQSDAEPERVLLLSLLSS